MSEIERLQELAKRLPNLGRNTDYNVTYRVESHPSGLVSLIRHWREWTGMGTESESERVFTLPPSAAEAAMLAML